jgi:hypothetical protein
MCASGTTGSNISASTHTQRTMNTWLQVQARRRESRQGYRSASYSDNTLPNLNNNLEYTDSYSNDEKCYGSVPAPIDTRETWRIIGENVNGLRPFGDMTLLITVAERLRALQTESVAFSETNVEWHKYELRENIQKLFTKAIGAARMEYCTSSDKFETTYHKRGGTTRGALGQMVHRVIVSGRDETGCGRWYQITYAAKENKKITLISAYIICKQTNPGDITASKQQHGIMYEDEEMRTYIVDPHKQTIIDLQYHVEKLKTDGHEVLICMEANQAEEQVYQATYVVRVLDALGQDVGNYEVRL